MDKFTILKEAIFIYNPQIDGIFKSINKYNKHITLDLFLQVLSKDSYNLKQDLGVSSGTVSSILKKVFPDRKTTTTGDKPDNYLLGLYEYKWCGKCRQVRTFEDFRKNSLLKYGLNTYCKNCHLETTSSTQPLRQSQYRCSLLHRTPFWANLAKIEQFYINCPKDMQVDHYIPLQGKLVSGLHVHNNLQYLSKHDNCSKSNKYEI
jgi:hypothetical protein